MGFWMALKTVTEMVQDDGETDPKQADSDGDGLGDFLEDANGNGQRDLHETDPYADTDGDGIDDGIEDHNQNGPGLSNDPSKIDTDGDGLNDQQEDYRRSFRPRDRCILARHHGDGLLMASRIYQMETLIPEKPTHASVVDSDGLDDGLEVSTAGLILDDDTDGDGIIDGVEDQNRNGQVDEGESDPASSDTDGDGLSDSLEDQNRNGRRDPDETCATEVDSDRDGISDGIEDRNVTT